MKKLRLNPEDLTVETFAPVQSMAGGGTVRGHGDSVAVCDPEEPDSINVCATDPSICGSGGCGTAGATCGGTCGSTCGTTCGCGTTLFSPSGQNTCDGYNTCAGYTCEEIYGAGCAGPQLPGC